MALFTDIDMGNQHGRRRRYLFESNELDILNAPIAPGATVQTQTLYAPGFVHFAGQVDLTTPIATTVDIAVHPIIEDNITFPNDQFIVATITTLAPLRSRYPFYWGEARGLLTGARGSTYCLSAAFRLRLINTGANAVTVSNIIGLECIS